MMNTTFNKLFTVERFFTFKDLFTFEGMILLLSGASVMAVFIAILLDFSLFDKRLDFKRQKRSIVATGTMIAFFVVYYLVILFKLGQLTIDNGPLRRGLAVLGALMVAVGAGVNILGRFQLKSNWSNHIKIYEDQSLVTTGVYGIVRHPLYASLMLMLLGGSLIYLNYLSALLTLGVFIPFMHHRARLEEVLLAGQFKNYSEYKRKTGMFFPKLWRR